MSVKSLHACSVILCWSDIPSNLEQFENVVGGSNRYIEVPRHLLEQKFHGCLLPYSMPTKISGVRGSSPGSADMLQLSNICVKCLNFGESPSFTAQTLMKMMNVLNENLQRYDSLPRNEMISNMFYITIAPGTFFQYSTVAPKTFSTGHGLL